MAKIKPRGKAAEMLLEGMPEEDPASSQPSAPPAPPMEGMPEQSEMAPEDPSMPPPDAGMPPGGPEGAPEAPDIDSALSGVEAAIQGFSEDAAREIRTHIEAIKDIASKEGGDGSGATQDGALTEPPPDMPSSADLGGAMGTDERG